MRNLITAILVFSQLAFGVASEHNFKDLRIIPKATGSQPTGAEGQFFTDLTTHRAKYRDNSAFGNLVGPATTDLFTNKTIDDALDSFVNTSDNLKVFKFSLGGSSTATVTRLLTTSSVDRNITLPNASDTLMGKATVDTMTNKTFDAEGTGNSISNIKNADIKAAAAIAVNKLAALTASRAMVTDGSGFASAATTTATEIGYVNGVTSALQTQLNAKSDASPGLVIPYVGRTAPAGYLLADGSSVSRATYSALFAVMNPTVGTFTVTVATPAVATLTAHGMQTCELVQLTTSGALPTGLSVNTDYWVTKASVDTLNFSTSLANCLAGTKINTTGTQSGTHTLQFFSYGSGNGTTTFTLPDLRGRVVAGADAMGGTAANNLTTLVTGVSGGTNSGKGAALGGFGGKEDEVLTIAQLAAHTHTLPTTYQGTNTPSTLSKGDGVNVPQTQSTNSTGGDAAHTIVQPTLILNYIIKY